MRQNCKLGDFTIGANRVPLVFITAVVFAGLVLFGFQWVRRLQDSQTLVEPQRYSRPILISGATDSARRSVATDGLERLPPPPPRPAPAAVAAASSGSSGLD
jgi:hypothetical protein